MCRQILPLGFESIQPFFWQTLGSKDMPRLAGEIREAIGDADVVVSALGMFGNPLEDEDARPRDARRLGNADRQRASLRHRHCHRLHRPGPRQAAARQPAALQGGLGRLARRAADKGVRIAFENCAMDGNWATGDWNIAHNPDAWELMFDELPDDNLGLEWEPCHQLVYLIDPIPQIRKWAPKIFHVHGKDATVRWDVIREHGVFGKVPFVQMRTPGFGDSDWARVISELQARRLQRRDRHRGLARPGLSRRAGDDRPGAGARLSEGMPRRGRARAEPGLKSGDGGHRQHRRQAGIIEQHLIRGKGGRA